MNPIPNLKHGLWAAAWLILALPAQAVLTVENAAVDATNATSFLIEAEELNDDPAADREAVNAALLLQLFNPSFTLDDEIEIEATLGLVQVAGGGSVALKTGGTTVVATETFTNGPRERRTVTLPAALQPAAMLNPELTYRVAASVRYRIHGGAWSAPAVFNGTPRKWVHFVGNSVDDASLHVLPLTGSLSVLDTQILRTVPSQNAFTASLNMTLHRYDQESVAQPAAPVPVHFALRLINSATLTEVALETPAVSVTRSLLARSLHSPPNPVTDAWTQTLTFAPAAGEVIDPTATYQLEVTVSAEEPDTTPIPAMPGVKTSVAERYLVLSGRLSFGGVETLFTEIANNPSPPMVLNAGIYSTQLAVVEGSAPAAPGRRYGDGTTLSVTYDPSTGDATVTGGTQNLTTTATDIVPVGSLRLVRGVIRMDFGGAQLESGGVILPAGFGVSLSQVSLRHQFALEFGGVEPLNNDFTLPYSTKVFTPPPGQYFYAFCDRLPLRFRTSAITWKLAGSSLEFTQTATNDPADPAMPVLTRQFLDEELTSRAHLLADASAAVRPSNDGYLRNITDLTPIIITTGAQGEALLTVMFDLGPGQTQTHFPQGVALTWTNGRFHLEESVVTNPSYLTTAASATVSYKRDCDGGCGTNAGPGSFAFTPASNRYLMTQDGGLKADGSLIPERLRWGTTELAGGGSPPEGGLPYAHQTNQWSAGAFHAAGGWLSGAAAPEVSEAQRAQTLMLSGVLPDGSYERPLTEGYRAGLADYSGLNLRVGAPAARQGRSVLAGISTPDYDLKARSKYYVRMSGVTGIHEAITASFPSGLVMYGFGVNLDGFRLAFRDGLNVESKTSGSVHVDSPVSPYPGFDLAFKDLTFRCRGQPHQMQLATEGETKTLAYWGTDITPLSMEFAQPKSASGCFGVSDGFLLVGVQTRFPSVTPQKLHASLGFMSNGNLVTRANPLSAGLDVDSRFTLPPTIEIVGGGDVPWEATVAGQAYLNNPLPSAPGYQQPAQGFLTFPATINVPWFEDMKVQLHVSASSTANAETSVVHVMGGWPANPAEGHGTGWQISDQNYFTNKQFDSDNLAFPAGQSVAAYRDGTTDANNARAQKRWLGVVDFDFPLVWDSTLRRFRSNKQTNDLLVLGSVDRQVQSLSPSTTEITFGLEAAIPRLNTQGLVAAVKEGISSAVADALTNALGGALKAQLGTGINELDGLLSERINALYQAPINAAVDPVVDEILQGSTATAQLPDLRVQLSTLPALGLLDQVDARLAEGINAVNATLLIVGATGDRGNMSNLVRELLDRAGVPGTAALPLDEFNDALAEVLPAIEPDLDRAQEILVRVRDALQQSRTRVVNQVTAAFQETISSLNAAAGLAATDIDALIARHEWQLLDANAKRERVRRLVSERVMACATVPKFQFVVRQHVQDSNEAFRAALDNVLGQANHLVRAVIETVFDAVEAEAMYGVTQSRSPAVGEMGPSSGGSGKLAGLNIEGYAQINDESLRVLDINGQFEFNIPDALLVQAHLRIEEYDANSPRSGCRDPGVMAAVVQIDARAECEWIGAEGTIVEVGAKFSLQNGKPIGFDGYFALQGEIMLGPVEVNEARFVAGFGGFKAPDNSVKTWGYVGAKIRGSFKGYEAQVGVFFGRVCNALPLIMIDPQVGNMLEKSKVASNGPVTGVYFYGEAWIPINEVYGIPSTCLFTVKAGVGAGFFAFISDGGAAFIGCKQLFGVEGTLLCVFSIRGEMTIIGAVTTGAAPATGASANNGLYDRANDPDTPPSGSFILYGQGKFSAKMGICPVCLKVSKSVDLTWTIGGEHAGLDIEF